MPERPDNQLAADYLRGDAGALEILIKRHLRPLYGFICRYVRSASDAEDITQEVFVRVWRHLKKFDQGKSFKTWIFSIAKNACVDWLRKRKTAVLAAFGDEDGEGAALDSLADPAPLPDELLQRRDLADALSAVLAGLPPDYRMVVLLYYHEQFNFREISEIIGEPLNTVKSRHRRALILLKKHLTGAQNAPKGGLLA